ncbi:unnamed protein product [Ceutorhynchus assimilis]|uniref:C-type lectin domain-containing protein n=1 Tax=Ceutorhynchus assimilis TaxID=467358 RepID=A0A9N9MDW4_9CUCU|nr:unnamed protein product [Ceutorhynchus assimilis]
MKCRLHLHPESSTFNHQDLPKSIDCKIWFPSPNDGHGLVVELLKLNVPCNKGFIHFGGTNQTQYQHGRNLHKLCGKLEELPDSDRNIYFPETSKSLPFMHVHGKPTFAISYRLVDYCYNITFMDKDGTVELKPSGQLQCTFRIYMPYGNRVALKLQIGDSKVKEDPNNNVQLNFQDTKNGELPHCQQGLLTQLHDGDSDWSHCTKTGDRERQIEFVSKANKIVLKATRDSVETSASKLRMSYRAVPVPEIVGSCEFGWVAVRQFCVSARDSVKMSWPKAEGECVRLGGHLVSVRSERDQKILDNLLTNR